MVVAVLSGGGGCDGSGGCGGGCGGSLRGGLGGYGISRVRLPAAAKESVADGPCGAGDDHREHDRRDDDPASVPASLAETAHGAAVDALK